MAQYVSPDTSGMGKQETIDAVVQAYQHISDSAGQTATKLDAIAAPTFAQGKKLATGLQSWFADLSTVYGDGAATIKDGSYDTPDDHRTAISKVESGAATANTKLSTSVQQVSPQVAAAMLALPSCATFASTLGR
jgi:hypothetical protein